MASSNTQTHSQLNQAGNSNQNEPSTSSATITDVFSSTIKLVKIFSQPEMNKYSTHDCIEVLRKEFSKIAPKRSKCTIQINEEANVSSTNHPAVRELLNEVNLPDPVAVYFNVKINTVELTKLLNKLPKIVQNIRKINVFVVDMNVTRDFVETNASQFDDLSSALGKLTIKNRKTQTPEKKSIFGLDINHLTDLFRYDKWHKLSTADQYIMYAYTVNEIALEPYPSVGILAQRKNSNEPKLVYVVKGLPKQDFVDRFNHKDLLTKDYNIMNLENNSSIIYLKSEEPMGELNTNGIYTHKGYTYPKIENVKFFKDEIRKPCSKELKSQNDVILGEQKQKLIYNLNPKNWKSLQKNQKYLFFGFTVDEAGKYPSVGVLAEENDNKSKFIYRMKETEDTREFLDLFKMKNLLQKEFYKVISFENLNLDLMFLNTEQPLGKFQTSEIVSIKGYKYPKIDNLEFFK